MRKFLLLFLCITTIGLLSIDAQSVETFVWDDLNGDGIQDAGEPGIAGADVQLWTDANMNGVADGGDANTGIVSTEAGGVYTFAGVADGSYFIIYNAIGAYYTTEGNYDGSTTDAGDGTDDSDIDFAIGSGNTQGNSHPFDFTSADDPKTNVDAGFFLVSTVGDLAFEDTNGNGVQDGGELGLSGVNISITDGLSNAVTDVNGNAVGPQVSDGAGAYDFTDLVPGDYIITFDQPATYYYTTVDVTGGNTDATDPTNDSDGDPANAGMTHVITLTSGEDNNNIYTGYYMPSSVGDFVFHDRDYNGVFDNLDSPVENITVNLLDALANIANDVNGVPLVTTTDGAGLYSFVDVPPGNYSVQFVAPGWLFTQQDFPGGFNTDATDINNDSDADPGNGQTHFFLLESGEAVEDRVDCGIYKQIMVGGTIWNDDDQDCAITAGETPIGAVTVQLFDGAGNLLDQVVTDATGTYIFNNVDPGVNFVILVVGNNFAGGPLNAHDSSPCQGGDDDIDDDDNGDDDVTDGSETVPFELLCGLEPGNDGIVNMTFDFGFFVEFDCEESTLSEPACELLDETDLLCDLTLLDSYCAVMTLENPGPDPEPLCPNGGVANNMSWFSFVAGNGSYQIEVVPTGCTTTPNGFTGVQTGIYTDCTFSESVICNSDCSTAPVMLDANVLTPGEVYYFFLDGCDGSICQYDVNITGNFTPYEIPEPTGLTCDLDNCTDPLPVVCPGAEVVFTVEGLDIDITYYWNLPVDVDVIDPLDPGSPDITNENNITLSFLNEGTYTICMTTATNNCDGTDVEVCKDIKIENLEDEDFGEVFVCENEIVEYNGPDEGDPNGDGVIGWQETGTSFSEGVNTVEITSPDGCMYQQTVEIVAIPINDGDPEIVEAADCEPFEITGPDGSSISIDNNVENLVLAFDNASAQGCDTFINVTAYILQIEGEIQNLGCTSDGVNLIFGLTNISLPIGDVNLTYTWYDNNNDEIADVDGDPKTCTATASGTITLEITMEKFGVECVYPFTIDIDFDNLFPPASTVTGFLTLCESATTTSYVATNPDNSVYQWNWTVPSPASIIYGQSTDSIVVQWNGSLGGEICVTAENACGQEMEPSCITIVLTEAPTADFSLDAEVCKDSSTVITNLSSVSASANFTWFFDGGTVTNGTGGVGAGPHEVSWSSSGNKMIILGVEENGCVSVPDTQYIEVINAPVIVLNCTPSTNGVEFYWDGVDGATGYDVQVLDGGPTGVLVDTTYTVTGLSDGDEINILLIVHTGGPCGDITQEGNCVVQNCTPPEVELSVVNDSICVDNTTAAFDIMVNTTPPSPGTSTFTGTGITDAALGTFDPVIAGAGVHSISYQLITDLDDCIANSSIVITVIELPTSTFEISDDTICIKDATIITYTGNDATATYNWDFGTDVDQSGGGIGPFDVSWTSSGTKTIQLEVVKGFCTSTITSLDVLVEDSLAFPVITCGPNGTSTSIDFVWGAVANADSYDIEIDGSPVGNQTALNYEITGLTPGDERTILVTAISNNSCPSASKSFKCEAKECPTFTLEIVDVDPICLSTNVPTVNLSATQSGGDENGVFDWNGLGIIPGGTVFDPSVAGVGIHEIILTYSEGSCTAKDTIEIIVNETPIASFSGDSLICITEQTLLTFNGTPADDIDVIVWNGGSAIEEATSSFKTALYSWEDSGEFTVSLTITDNGCESETFTETIVVEPELEVKEITCGSTISSVTFSWEGQDCANEYEVIIDDVSMGIFTDLSYTVTDLTQNEEVNIKVIAISTCECGDIEMIGSCMASACDAIGLEINNPFPNICVGDVDTPFELTATINGDNSGIKAWGGTGIDNLGIFNPNGLDPGAYDIVCFYALGECSYFDTTVINILENPVLQIDAPVDPKCYDDITGLISYSGTASVPIEVRLDNNIVDNVGVNIPVGLGNHTMEVKTNDGCTENGGFSITAPDEPDFGISGSEVITIGQSEELTLLGISGIQGLIDSIQWTSSEGVLCNSTSCESITISPEIDDEYCVTVRYNDGCLVEDCITVRLKSIPVEFPTLFSPGSSDQNSVFHMSFYNTGHELKSLKVYDRWGGEIFVQDVIENNEVSWDGKFKGKIVSPGVYIFVMETIVEGGRVKVYTGDVTVIR